MKKIFLLFAVVIATFLSSCQDTGDTGSATRLNIRMTDAPGAYDAILLSVKEIRVLTSEGESTLPVNSDFDILRFRMGKDTLLASQDIPSGRINEIRVVLNETGNKVIIDGVDHNLTTPSAHSSGLKLKVNDDLTSGVEYTLKLDFDAAKSIVKTGNGKYILKPVIRVIPSTVSGALTGIISPAASNSKIYAITGTDTVGTVADTTGKFFFYGMPSGTYKVNIAPQSPYLPKTIENVQIVTGSVNNLGIITLTQ